MFHEYNFCISKYFPNYHHHTGVTACQDDLTVLRFKNSQNRLIVLRRRAALPHPSTSSTYCLDPPSSNGAVFHRSAIYLSECFALGMEGRVEPWLCHGKPLNLAPKTIDQTNTHQDSTCFSSSLTCARASKRLCSGRPEQGSARYSR